MMKKIAVAVVTLALLVFAFQNCSPRQDREIGYYILPEGVGTATQLAKYQSQIEYGKKYGMQYMEATFAWDSVENPPGTLNADYVHLANSVLSGNSIKGLLALNPLNINANNIPSDLRALDFDNPQILVRYKALLDFVIASSPDTNWLGITIGNEVDSFLGSDTVKWAQYTKFVERMIVYIHNKYPNIPVGVKCTLAGLTGARAAEMQRLNAQTDVVYVTYFPALDSLADPNIVKTDFQKLLAKYPTRRIEVMEIGFPSSTELGSSEQLQAQFVDQLFDVWDTYLSQIKRMNFVLLYELTPAQLDRYAPLIGGNPTQRAFWGSVGLHNSQCGRKPAFDHLQGHLFFRLWSVPDPRIASPGCSL